MHTLRPSPPSFQQVLKRYCDYATIITTVKQLLQ
jgi:hypothetical protein